MPAMLPNGDTANSTPTRTLLELTHGMNNKSITIVVTELSTLKTTKNGTPFMHVYGVNDEEEPLRISVWGKPAVDTISDKIKINGLHEFRGLTVRECQPVCAHGQLPYDLNFNNWSDVTFLQGDYKIKGLPLTSA